MQKKIGTLALCAATIIGSSLQAAVAFESSHIKPDNTIQYSLLGGSGTTVTEYINGVSASRSLYDVIALAPGSAPDWTAANTFALNGTGIILQGGKANGGTTRSFVIEFTLPTGYSASSFTVDYANILVFSAANKTNDLSLSISKDGVNYTEFLYFDSSEKDYTGGWAREAVTDLNLTSSVVGSSKIYIKANYIWAQGDTATSPYQIFRSVGAGEAGSGLRVDIGVQAIPEPASAAFTLGLLSLAAVSVVTRRRKN